MRRDEWGGDGATAPAEAELARLRRFAIVDELLTTVGSARDVGRAMADVSDIAGRVLDCDTVEVLVLTDDRTQVVSYSSGGTATAETPRTQPLTDEARRLATDPWQFEIPDDRPKGQPSTLRVPVRLDGRVEAILTIQSKTPRRYGPADVAVAQRIAAHVAVALSHQRLADQAREAAELRARAAALELVDELLTTLVDASDLPEVFDRVSAIARRVLAHDMLLMIVGMPGGRRARLYASSGAGANPFPDEYDVPPEIVADRHWDAEIIDDLSLHPIWRHEEGAKRGYRSCIEMAIRLEGELVAVLAFLSFARGLYRDADLLVARRIRDRLALDLTRGRGAEASKRADDATARAALLESRVRALTDELNARSGARRIVGSAPAWRSALTQATQVAGTETTVLLLGESGTGKEVVARFIHGASSRAHGPFVALNCAALPEQLLEAELFGYERGAFTGATQSKPGQLEQAAGGILFLDEVGEMNVSAQAKFLRVLEEREFQRLGGTRALKTDARIIAATNRDLLKAIDRGQFREDLYYRLNVFTIHLPPLRDRRDDVLALSETFITEIGKSIGRPPAGISREARRALLEYHWPGNVRELRNVLERAAILCDGGLIAAEHLALRPASTPDRSPAHTASTPPARSSESAPTHLKSVERAMIVQALKDAQFNKSEAARALGLTRAQLYVRLRQHGLDKRTLKTQ